MYCKNCGKQIADDSKFCKYCGTLVDDSMTTMIILMKLRQKLK